jgi:diacylglycerol kinase (ATP)
VIIVLNERAGYGRAAARWKAVRPELETKLGPLRVVTAGSIDDARDAVAGAVGSGERAVIAAGGDGTVNLLVNAIMTVEGGDALALGAVGLGSSNDFHKPVGSRSVIEGIPARIDCDRAREVDVMRVEYGYGDDGTKTGYAIINASIGISAEANYNFNHPTGFTRAASRLSVDAAIVASVIRTLATYRDIPCRIRIDGGDEGRFMVSNLGIIKNPHFAGSFCYDTPIAPDDGKLGINLCERLSRLQVLTTLAALSRKHFQGRPKTRCWEGERVVVEAGDEFALEMDGEVVRARRSEFTVLPRRLRCCV